MARRKPFSLLCLPFFDGHPHICCFFIADKTFKIGLTLLTRYQPF
ncbi:hypothetical protein HMPREF1981_00614 [Bacteroides pyogenes F0041]|uniref:Uncharacterized protein n=1 Tax=Bacteroides pyogenes F0041 TaxID=1321819 RepID=U2CUL0_9BACE|nr:hypothetical protein HMPREF1981_00614 [Bacteroides pyogenes F0041]